MICDQLDIVKENTSELEAIGAIDTESKWNGQAGDGLVGGVLVQTTYN